MTTTQITRRSGAPRLNAAGTFPARLAARLKIDSLPVQAEAQLFRGLSLYPLVNRPLSELRLHLMHHDAFTRALKRPLFPVFFGKLRLTHRLQAAAKRPEDAPLEGVNTVYAHSYG